MTTKRLSHKQVIVPMSNENKTKFMELSSDHIAHLNRSLKDIKSEVLADFVYYDNTSIIIVTNKVVSPLDLQTIEKYVKNLNLINVDNVDVPQLPQSKFYLKITGIPYFLENTNIPISANIAETIIKNNHIFNNIVIASRPHIIKVSPRSNMAII